MPRPRANWDSVGFHGGSRGPHPERAGGSPDGRATAGGEKKIHVPQDGSSWIRSVCLPFLFLLKLPGERMALCDRAGRRSMVSSSLGRFISSP